MDRLSTSTIRKDSSFSDTKNSIIEDGNKFGRDIEFREGVPIQLLKCSKGSKNGDFGQMVLNPEALDILQTIHEPLSIISVVGSYRHGKSWFANVLHGRHNGFKLGSKVEGCTRGIYMWSPPFKLESKQSDGKTIQKRVIVLDSEGIDDPDQDENWATKLFILCLVVSSTLVYNINGIIGKDDIGKLCLLTDLSKFIQEPEEGDFLPRLVVLLRDFTFETPKNFKDYFLERLSSEAAKSICKSFYDFDVYSLSHPGCERKMLQHMEEAKTDELDEDFVNGVENAVKAIYSHLPLKYIGASAMKGIAFVKFLRDIVERMNSSEISALLSVPSEYESVIQFVAQAATNEAIGIYKKRMDKEEEKLPMLWEEFDKIHDECISEVRKLFSEKIIGSPAQIGSFVERLNEELSSIKREFTERNSIKLMIYNENIAKELWEKFVKIGLIRENSFKSNKEFQEALCSFELAYKKLMMKSPEAVKVIASYMQNQYSAAIDYIAQLGKMDVKLAKAIHAKEEAERIRLEALAREGELCRQIETQKREYEETERNFKNKMLELQSNIAQQHKSNEKMRQRLIEEREQLIERYDQKYKKMHNSMLEQQKNHEISKIKLIEQQKRNFEQTQRSIIEENNRRNEEIRMQLTQEKGKALQDKFYQNQLLRQIEENGRKTQAMLEQMQMQRGQTQAMLKQMHDDQECIGIDWTEVASTVIFSALKFVILKHF